MDDYRMKYVGVRIGGCDAVEKCDVAWVVPR